MRYQAALSSVLAAALVPALYFGDGELATLEDALAETTRALEVLSGLSARAEQGDPQSVDFVRSVTEAPILEARRRDERLVDLRNQVNLLQAELDVLEVPAFVIEPTTTSAVPGAGMADDTGTDVGAGMAARGTLPRISAGLSPEQRALLTAPEPTRPAAEVPQPGPSDEAPGYSADPLAHARACFHARRYEKCVALAEELPDSADAQFWKSRALEKLGRLDQAIAAMQRSLELSGEGPVAHKAKAELEFLQWRRSFLQDAPHLSAEKLQSRQRGAKEDER